MIDQLAIFTLPLLFVADYVAIICWLMRTGKYSPQSVRFRLRTLLIGTTIVAIHLATFSAFFSAQSK